MRSLPLTLVPIGCLLLGVAVSPVARAQADVDRATARTLGEEGNKALDAKDFKTAEDDFRRAESLVHAPTLLLGLARALAGEGKLVEAQETYKRIVREGVSPGAPPAFQKAVADAATEVEAVTPKIGSVKISVKGPAGEAIAAPKVTWDSTPVNAATLGVKRPADPGAHMVHVSADGYVATDLKVDVPVGGSVDAPVTLQKDTSAPVPPPPLPPGGNPPPGGGNPPPPPPPESASSGSGFGVWPWVALGVGGAGLVTGAITGVLALGKHNDIASKCSGGTCPSSQQSNIDSYNTLGAISTVGFIVGGVGAAAGVTLLFLQPKAEASPAPAAAGLHITPVVGLGSLGAVGTF